MVRVINCDPDFTFSYLSRRTQIFVPFSYVFLLLRYFHYAIIL
jgi:hypothetical protein